jgi:transcriptional/translational regulatory protein YebC/TACO1
MRQTDDESYEANVAMLEKLLDNGDVDTVYHNQEMDEDEEESE